MKIFNKENEQEKVYVQLNDIMELTQTNMPIPASIIDKVFGGKFLIVDDSNRDDFVEFDKKEEIDFFKSIEWITDYKKYRDLTQDELKLLIEETNKEIDDIATKYNTLSYTEKENNLDLYERYNMLCLKIEDIKKIYLLKSGEYQLTFPLVPDSDGFSLGCDDSEIPYKISASLDPQKYLLYREDGKELHNDDCIPSNFIQNGLMIAFMEKKNIPQMGEFELSFNFSEDNKYLVVNLKELEEKKYEETKKASEKKGIKKVLNKIFNKKKKS